MATSGDFIKYASSSMHYHRWGRGNKLLLCFHGYGETAASFAFLEEALGSEFTILAMDLPFHGETKWKEYSAPATPSDPNQTLPFTVHHLLAILKTLLSTLATPDKTPWYLMGYSMGGRVALSLLEAVPEKIARLVLLAPDGLRLNPWYWLATQTAPGRLLFRYTMHHPGWFFFLLRTGNTLKLVNPSIYKFVSNYIDDRQVRQDLYTRWTALRTFRPHIGAVKAIVRRWQLPIRILYGRFDRIILAKRGEEFRKDIEPYCQLTVLSAGHQLLQISHLPALLSLLKG